MCLSLSVSLSLYMYIYLYTHVYIRTFVHSYICVHSFIHSYVCICIPVPWVGAEMVLTMFWTTATAEPVVLLREPRSRLPKSGVYRSYVGFSVFGYQAVRRECTPPKSLFRLRAFLTGLGARGCFGADTTACMKLVTREPKMA